MAAAAEHSHCQTSLDSAQLLSERQAIMAKVNAVDRREEGTPTPVPADEISGRTQGGGRTHLLLALSHLTIDHACLSRRSTVPTPNRHTSNLGAHDIFPICYIETFFLILSHAVLPSVATVYILSLIHI